MTDSIDTSSESASASAEANPVSSLMSRLEAHFASESGDSAPSDDSAPADESTPADAPKESKDSKDSKDPKEPPKEDDDPRGDLARARERAEMRQVRSDALKFKAQAEELSRKYSEVESLAKTNPVKLIEKVAGMSFQEFMQRTIKGDFDDNAPKIPPEIEQKLKLVEEWERERAEQARAQERQRQMEADLPRVKELLDETKYPLLAGREDGAQVVLDIAYEMLDKGEKPNVPEIMAGLERSASDAFTTYLTNAKFINALLAKPSIRTSIMEALGLQKKQSAGPASSSTGSQSARESLQGRTLAPLTEVPSRSDRESSEEDEKAELARELRAWRETHGAMR